MALRPITGRQQMSENLRLPYDRRSGIDRRNQLYDNHLPERRGGTERRVSVERRADWMKVFKWSSAWKELWGIDSHLID